MYVRRYISSRTSLTFKAYRNFATTICIMAGSPSHDVAGAKIMRKIQEESSEPVTFFGIGGPEMEALGLVKNYGNINTFTDKPLVPVKNYLRNHIIRPFHPVTFRIHSAAKTVFKQLLNEGFLEDITEYKPDLFLTVGNEFYMNRAFTLIGDFYYRHDMLKPPMVHYDNFVHGQRKEFEDFCDYWLYTIPKDPVNWPGYKFPSTYVGSFAAGRALEYLYKQSSKSQALVDKNTILISKEHNSVVVDTLVDEERARFREKNGIDQEATVFYALPGNQEHEVKWAIDLIHKSVTTFLDKQSQYGAENFVVVIPTYPTLEDFTYSEIEKHKWPCRVIKANTEQEKYSALAASDMGACLSGEAVSECIAYRIPVVILNKMPWYQAYATLLYNSFASPYNIAVNGEAYPELLGQALPGKVAEYWSDWFEQPRTRFLVVRRFDNLALKILPSAGGDPVSEHIETKAVAQDTIEFSRYYQPEYLTAKKILGFTRAYQEANANAPNRAEMRRRRLDMLEKVLV